MMTATREHIESLLFEKIAGTISEEDNLVVELAISNDTEVQQIWDEIQAKMGGQKSVFLNELNVDKAWAGTAQRIALKPKSRRLWSAKFSAAAAILLISLPIGWYLLSARQIQAKEETLKSSGLVYLKTDEGKLIGISKDQKIMLGNTTISSKGKALSYQTNAGAERQWATLVVPAAKDHQLKLSDGTLVWLNAGSSIRFPFNFGAGQREVYLKGEAYFQVTKNPKQRFIVHTNVADIQVYGTSFNVSAYDSDSFSTALVEGSIAAKKDNREQKLKPGQQLRFINGHEAQLTPFDAQEILGWMKGTYYFHNQSVKQIAPVISRWFNIKVNLENDMAAKQTFTGEIDRNLPLSVLISNLQIASGTRIELKNGVLTFK